MQNGIYFVTVCVKERHHLFGSVRDGKMVLSENGEHARRCAEQIERVYPSVILNEFVVMPNHVHLLMTFADYDANPLLKRVISQYKAAVTKEMGFSPWQDGSYPRAILTNKKYKIVKQYIKENPARWETDQFALRLGEYDSPPEV